MAQTKDSRLNQPGEPRASFPGPGGGNDSRAAQRVATKASIEARESARELSDLLTYFPYGPGFFGTELIYPKQKEGIFRRKPNADLSTLRKEVNNFTSKQGVSKCRTEIKDLLKAHPYFAEAHSLNAILVFNDAMQAGAADLNKLQVIRDALTEMGKALHNGALSLFSVNWLIAMYSSYLGFLNDRLVRVNSATENLRDEEVHKLRKDLSKQLLMIRHLGRIKDLQKGLKRMNGIFQKTGYFVIPLTKPLVAKAAHAYLQGGKDKQVGDEPIKCGLVLQLHFTIAQLFSNLPILVQLVAQMLDMVPEDHRDFVLQKRLVLSNQSGMDFYLALAQGDTPKAKELAEKLFAFHTETITEYLSESLLDRPFMVDPFIKYAWLVKDSHSLFRPGQVTTRVDKALAYLRIIQGERCQVEGSHQVASPLVYDMSRLKSEHEDKS